MRKAPNYVSQTDQFLEELRAKVPLSASQLQEMEKYRVVGLKRDNVIVEEEVVIWEKF